MTKEGETYALCSARIKALHSHVHTAKKAHNSNPDNGQNTTKKTQTNVRSKQQVVAGSSNEPPCILGHPPCCHYFCIFPIPVKSSGSFRPPFILSAQRQYCSRSGSAASYSKLLMRQASMRSKQQLERRPRTSLMAIERTNRASAIKKNHENQSTTTARLAGGRHAGRQGKSSKYLLSIRQSRRATRTT